MQLTDTQLTYTAHFTRMDETIESVLTFWFGNGLNSVTINEEKKAMWWGKNSGVDAEIEHRFQQLAQAVSRAELEHWRESAKGLLASIICTDQFPRNMFRDSGKAFAWDEKARSLAREAVATGVDKSLLTIQRVFVYMPYEHSESLEDQEECLKLFAELAEDAVTEGEPGDMYQSFVGFAKRHHEIIARFGRFPHRNHLLGRDSTDEEKKFLTQPGSSF